MSIPFGAKVFVDGQAVGQTPLIDTPLAEGSRTLRLVYGRSSSEHTIRVGRRDPVRHVWTIAEDSWESGF